MSIARSISPAPRSAWLPNAGRDETREHRCSNCFGPHGKSAIPCKNEPQQPKWWVKVRRLDGAMIVAIRTQQCDADALVRAMNTEYQTDEYFAQEAPPVTPITQATPLQQPLAS